MPRIARVVAAGLPHHVIQRGNRRQRTFFGEADYRAYLELMAEWCSLCGVEVWAYCLMPNHVHLIVVPRRRTACVALSAKLIGATRVESTFGDAGAGINGRDGSPLLSWLSPTC